MRKKINDIFKNKNKSVEEEVKIGPIVLYENDKVMQGVERWISYLEHDSFSEMLYKLGFKIDDKVYLYETSERYRYSYSVNEEERNDKNIIELSYGSMVDFGPQITVFDSLGFKCYDCVPHSSNYDGNDVMLNRFEKQINDTRSYRCSYFIYSYLIEFRYLDYKIFININKSIEDDEEIVINNQLELEEYLSKLEVPVSIIDLYNDLSRICELGNGKYVKIGIDVVKKDEFDKEETTDMIVIKNGIVDEFCMTKDGKRIYLSNTGDWLYKMVDDDDLVKFTMEFKDNKFNCNISGNSDNEIDDYMDSLFKYDMDVAKREVEDTKKLVRSMFPKK